jgi:hypothetical protein
MSLVDTVTKLKSPQSAEDSTCVEKLYQLEKELSDGLARFQIDDATGLPEKIQQTQERTRDEREEESEKQIETLTDLKCLKLLNHTITQLQSTRSVKESSDVMKLSYVEEELINGMATLKVADAKKLPEKIQQTEERIKEDREKDAEKQMETLTKLMFMTIIDDAITKAKPIRSVENSSSVLQADRFEQDSVSQ